MGETVGASEPRRQPFGRWSHIPVLVERFDALEDGRRLVFTDAEAVAHAVRGLVGERERRSVYYLGGAEYLLFVSDPAVLMFVDLPPLWREAGRGDTLRGGCAASARRPGRPQG